MVIIRYHKLKVWFGEAENRFMYGLNNNNWHFIVTRVFLVILVFVYCHIDFY